MPNTPLSNSIDSLSRFFIDNDNDDFDGVIVSHLDQENPSVSTIDEMVFDERFFEWNENEQLLTQQIAEGLASTGFVPNYDASLQIFGTQMNEFAQPNTEELREGIQVELSDNTHAAPLKPIAKYTPYRPASLPKLQKKAERLTASITEQNRIMDDVTSTSKARSQASTRKSGFNTDLQAVLYRISHYQNSIEIILNPSQPDHENIEPPISNIYLASSLKRKNTTKTLADLTSDLQHVVNETEKWEKTHNEKPSRKSKKMYNLARRQHSLQFLIERMTEEESTEALETNLKQNIAELNAELQCLDDKHKITSARTERQKIQKQKFQVKQKLKPLEQELEILQLKEKVKTLETSLETEKQNNAQLSQQNLALLQNVSDLSGEQLGKRVYRPW